VDSSIHFVKEVSVTSRVLEGGLGTTTCIEVSSQSKWSEEVTIERITLFSDDKLITSLNGKSIPHKRRKS
tara:strand:+ start:205 stop:414 length:210 start_codon:yes stop_codon:yes gene_type:complete